MFALFFAHRKKDVALVSCPSVPTSVQLYCLPKMMLLRRNYLSFNYLSFTRFISCRGAVCGHVWCTSALATSPPFDSTTLLSPTAKHLRSSTNTIAGTIPTDMRTCCKVDIKRLAERWFKPKAQELEHITRSVAIQL